MQFCSAYFSTVLPRAFHQRWLEAASLNRNSSKRVQTFIFTKMCIRERLQLGRCITRICIRDNVREKLQWMNVAYVYPIRMDNKINCLPGRRIISIIKSRCGAHILVQSSRVSRQRKCINLYRWTDNYWQLVTLHCRGSMEIGADCTPCRIMQFHCGQIGNGSVCTTRRDK